MHLSYVSLCTILFSSLAFAFTYQENAHRSAGRLIGCLAYCDASQCKVPWGQFCLAQYRRTNAYLICTHRPHTRYTSRPNRVHSLGNSQSDSLFGIRLVYVYDSMTMTRALCNVCRSEACRAAASRNVSPSFLGAVYIVGSSGRSWS